MSEQPMTWKQAREDVAALHGGLVGARDSANDAVLSPSRDVPVGAEYREAFCDLRWEVDGLASRAERLLEMLAESPEPEPPARPLEAVLADIRALGFRYSLSPNDVTTYLEAVGAGKDGSQWHTTWLSEISGGDVVAAAEVELARLRELYAAVVPLVQTLSYPVGYIIRDEGDGPYETANVSGWVIEGNYFEGDGKDATDAEKLALARVDRERETAASEEGQA